MIKPKTHIETKDFLVTGESFALVWDETHSMLLTSPLPEAAALSKYYQSDEYISHTDSKKGLFNFLYQWVKNYSIKSKLSLLSSFQKKKGTLLDIGAGTGDFLKAAQNKGWVVRGVEVNEQARTLSERKGIPLEENLDNFIDQQFDVVTLWHVLEHLPDLHNSISKMERLVKEGGTLIIAVPNFNSFDAKYYGAYWAAYDVPRHLWHFSKKSMSTLFSKQMHLVKIKPMMFDSFYVSLLSEKYKTGKSFSLRAFWIGLLSNLKARSTKEYSSLIYCYKKH